MEVDDLETGITNPVDHLGEIHALGGKILVVLVRLLMRWRVVGGSGEGGSKEGG